MPLTPTCESPTDSVYSAKRFPPRLVTGQLRKKSFDLSRQRAHQLFRSRADARTLNDHVGDYGNERDAESLARRGKINREFHRDTDLREISGSRIATAPPSGEKQRQMPRSTTEGGE